MCLFHASPICAGLMCLQLALLPGGDHARQQLNLEEPHNTTHVPPQLRAASETPSILEAKTLAATSMIVMRMVRILPASLYQGPAILQQSLCNHWPAVLALRAVDVAMNIDAIYSATADNTNCFRNALQTCQVTIYSFNTVILSPQRYGARCPVAAVQVGDCLLTGALDMDVDTAAGAVATAPLDATTDNGNTTLASGAADKARAEPLNRTGTGSTGSQVSFDSGGAGGPVQLPLLVPRTALDLLNHYNIAVATSSTTKLALQHLLLFNLSVLEDSHTVGQEDTMALAGIQKVPPKHPHDTLFSDMVAPL